jgi:hypothetical protein
MNIFLGIVKDTFEILTSAIDVVIEFWYVRQVDVIWGFEKPATSLFQGRSSENYIKLPNGNTVQIESSIYICKKKVLGIYLSFLQVNCYACCLLHAGFLLDSFFVPEDEGEMFFRNVSWFSTNYTALYYRKFVIFTLHYVCHRKWETSIPNIHNKTSPQN